MADSMRPGSTSLRDIAPANVNVWRKTGERLGILDPTFNPASRSHMTQIESIQRGIMAGQFNDDEIGQFVSKNPATIPFIQEAVRQREILRSNFQQPKAPVYEIPQDGQQRLVSPAEGGKADLGGAVVSALRAGDLPFAGDLAKFLPKERTEQNITSIQLGIRAEGRLTGDSRIDSIDPRTAANVLARTTSPVAVQTVGGTALYGRGGVPGGSLPSFLPEAPTAEEATRSARGEIAKFGLDRLGELVQKGDFTPGPVSGRLSGASGVTGIDLKEGEAEALSLIEGLSNDLLQAMRGAQVGPAEQIKFEKQLPRAEQPTVLFEANRKRTRENLVRLNQIIEQKRRGRSAKPPEAINSMKEMSNEELFKKAMGQ